MNMSKTRVTVLMPVYNAEKHLFEAIESILNQTYKEFELLIINDGSTDNSEKIIKAFKDKRIKYVANVSNMGIIKTLNKGILLIQSEYIVRMDADDISLPTRLEKQVKFMDQHQDIAVSGTSMLNFFENGSEKKSIVKSTPREINTFLLFTNALMHPTVIIRKKVIDEENFTYNEEHQAVEDYGLWQKMSFTNKLANMKEILLKYRVNTVGITRIADKDIDKRDNMHIRVYKQAFDYLGMNVTQKQLTLYRSFITGRGFHNKEDIFVIAELLRELKVFIDKPKYDLSTFNMLINMYYRENCINERLSYAEVSRIYRENFSDIFKFSLKEKGKFIIRRYSK